MTGKTHRVLGFIAGGGFLLLQPTEYQPATLGAILVASYFGSLLPDLDQPMADIWDSLPLGHMAGKLADPFLKHRNVSHSILGLAVFSYLFYLLTNNFPGYWNINLDYLNLSFILAYSSHLLTDMTTVEGLPFLYPYKRMFGIPPKPFHGIRIETGKWFENLVLFPALNLALIIIFFTNINKLRQTIFQ